MAGVEDSAVIVFRSLVQAVAAGFAVSHLQPETEGETPWWGFPKVRARPPRPHSGAEGPAGGPAPQEGVRCSPGQPGLSTPGTRSPSLPLSASPGPACSHRGWAPQTAGAPREGKPPPQQHRPG